MLIRGGSSVDSGDLITGMAWSLAVKVGCYPWFDRVESAANPTDGMSRGRLEGPWDLVPVRFPCGLWDEHLAIPASTGG